MGRTAFVAALFLAQALCAILFVSDVFSSIFGFESTAMSWQMREILEIAAALGLIIGAVLRRDYPVIQGGLLLLASIYVLVNIGVDLLYAVIDPRVRYD